MATIAAKYGYNQPRKIFVLSIHGFVARPLFLVVFSSYNLVSGG
jgi:hypothetical protein